MKFCASTSSARPVNIHSGSCKESTKKEPLPMADYTLLALRAGLCLSVMMNQAHSLP
jgi:hypothetical protein